MRFAVGRGRASGRAALPAGGPVVGARPPARRGRPRRERTGTEPSTALSDLPARRLLAAIFGPVYLLGAIFFALMAYWAKPGDQAARNTWIAFGAVCAVLALVAAVDLVVIRARMAEERRAGLAWRHDRPWVVRGEVVRPDDGPPALPRGKRRRRAKGPEGP